MRLSTQRSSSWDQEASRRRHLTTAEWVQQSLRTALDEERPSDPAGKLKVLAAAARYSFPAGDIEQMLAEIEAGYLDSTPEEP